MSRHVATVEHRNASASDRMNAQNAGLSAASAAVPGMVKGAANVTVAMRTDPMARFCVRLVNLLSSFCEPPTPVRLFRYSSRRRGLRCAPHHTRHCTIRTSGFIGYV